MNWNSNDTKYILKRFIIYILIAFAMFIIGTWKTKANTVSNYINYPANHRSMEINNGSTGGSYTPYNSSGNTYSPFINSGEGTLIFSYYTEQQSNPTIQINSVQIHSGNNNFACDVGSTTLYYDNVKLTQIVTAMCPVTFNNGNGLDYIWFSRATGVGKLSIFVGELATFVSKDSTNVTVDQQQVVNAVNTSNQSLITHMQQSNQAIIDSAHQDAQQAHQDAQDINNSINNDNITSSDADDFTNNQAFSDSTGLESVIQLPLNMVNSLTSTCQPIQITIPFINYTGQIPCMSTIYRSKFNTLYTIVKLVINGFFVYRLLLKVYELVHNAKQPDEDKLEVIDL